MSEHQGGSYAINEAGERVLLQRTAEAAVEPQAQADQASAAPGKKAANKTAAPVAADQKVKGA